MRPPAVRHHERDQDLVRPRRVGHPDLHRVEVGPDERRVLEVKRHVDRRTRSAELLGRRNDRLAATHRGAERRPQGRMKDGRRVLVLAVGADDSRLAV
jgi:hypothetical protein